MRADGRSLPSQCAQPTEKQRARAKASPKNETGVPSPKPLYHRELRSTATVNAQKAEKTKISAAPSLAFIGRGSSNKLDAPAWPTDRDTGSRPLFRTTSPQRTESGRKERAALRWEPPERQVPRSERAADTQRETSYVDRIKERSLPLSSESRPSFAVRQCFRDTLRVHLHLSGICKAAFFYATYAALHL